MGQACTGMGCLCCLCGLLLAAAAAGAGAALSTVCISELGTLLSAQALVILLWICARRPLVSITHLYLLLCFVLLSRETVVTISGRLPCGLATFDETCAETTCAEYHHIPVLGIRTRCARYECVRQERTEVSQVYTSAESLNKWTGTALLCVWLAFIISGRQLRKWRLQVRSARHEKSDTGSRVVEYVAVILAVPITYGLCALHALRVLSVNHEDTWQAEGMMSAAELYSAMALLSFQKLLEVYVKEFEPYIPAGGGDEEGACLGCEQKVAAIGQHTKVRRSFQQLVAMGLKQYVVLVFGCNAMEMIAKTWNWAYPWRCRSTLAVVAETWFPHHQINLTLNESLVHHSKHLQANSLACEDLWNTVSLLMVVANFFTCSIALYAVLMYEQTFTAMLEPVRPFWKFWGVKGLLSVNFLQRIVLMVLGALAASNPKLNHEFRTFLNFFLVCLESLGLAALNVCAYGLLKPSPVGDQVESQVLTEDRGDSMDAVDQEAELAEVIGKRPFDD